MIQFTRPRGKNEYRESDDGSVAIVLTQGFETAIDLADLPACTALKWMAQRKPYGPVYAVAWVTAASDSRKKTSLQAHILQPGSGFEVDHINGDTLDNHRSNLRLATRSQNMANKPKSKLNRSGFKGVSFHRQSGQWLACIRSERVTKNLGYFATATQAAIAYDDAARRLFGEFARLNFPMDGELAA